MDIDEDDDFYAPDEPESPAAQAAPATAPPPASKPDAGDELEEGEEEDEAGEMDEDEDSDIDIIVESKDPQKAAPPSQSRYSEIRNIPQRSAATESASRKGQGPKQRAVDQPLVSTSKIDVNAIPIHKQTGKPLTQVNIDEDLTDSDKPWRKPGTDLSDYFNYGFDEFTWALYAEKQETLRNEYNQDAMAQKNKKMMEEFSMMMMGGMVPGMGGAAAGGAGGAAGGAAMPGIEAMMASGVDLSQMDPNTMAAMYANAGGVGAAAQGGQGQNFGAGFGGNQGQGYGYDQGMSGGGNTGGGGGGGGGRGGRGRGRRW